MMFFIVFSLVFLVLPAALGAPTRRALDAATLLQNAQDAQILNTEFQSLSQDAACNSGQTACVNSSMAVCQFGSWKLSPCPNTHQCYAVPSMTSNGTVLMCTSEQTALSMINSAGAQGNVTASDNSNSTLPLPTSPQSLAASSIVSPSSPTQTPSTPSASPSPIPGVQTVTVTITQTQPAPISTLSETTTLDSEGVSSLFSSLGSNGIAVVSSTVSAMSTSTAKSLVSLTPFTTTNSGSSVASPSSTSASASQSSSSSLSFTTASTILLTTQNAVVSSPTSSTSPSAPTTGYTRSYATVPGALKK